MGKDNIVFHSQIWPAEMLAQNGKGSRGGDHNPFGQLNLPTEVVSSEFLTMEGKKFSSSHGIVIYVRDVLSRYQADALRYFISIAGPETADADFTWAEFVRRTNSELVAAWGNLVNRTASMIHKRFGQIPEPGEFTFEDRSLLAEIERGFKTVGDLIMHHRQKAALSEAMRLVGEANRYIAETEPFKLKSEDQQERLRTILFVLAQVVADLNLMLSPFLPHAANDVDRVMGGGGQIAPMPVIEEVTELDPQVLPADFAGRKSYPIITGDYTTPKPGFPFMSVGIFLFYFFCLIAIFPKIGLGESLLGFLTWLFILFLPLRLVFYRHALKKHEAAVVESYEAEVRYEADKERIEQLDCKIWP